MVKTGSSKQLPYRKHEGPPTPRGFIKQKQSHGLYRVYDIEKIDKRTRVFKTHQAIVEGLREYVGEMTMLADIIIGRIAYKCVRAIYYEIHKLKNCKTDQTESDHYLPLTNSLRCDLSLLQQLAQAPTPPNLNEYLKAIDGNGHNSSNGG